MIPKRLRLRPEQFQPLVKPMGSCFASDRITVDGEPVGMMRRETPEGERSGWSFFAGDESEAYTDDPNNFGLYEVNAIANFDPAIIPYLYALPGSLFDRDVDTNEFFEPDDSAPEEDAKLAAQGIDVVKGNLRLNEGWWIELPTPFRRRYEDDQLVLWRPSLTFWIAIWQAREDVAERLAILRSQISATATDVRETRRKRVTLLSFRNVAEDTTAKVAALHAWAVGGRGHLLLGIYADREEDIAAAREILISILDERPN